jgi:hypothetical protein
MIQSSTSRNGTVFLHTWKLILINHLLDHKASFQDATTQNRVFYFKENKEKSNLKIGNPYRIRNL